MAAWQLDELCLMLGRRVENNLSEGKDMFDGIVESPKTFGRNLREKFRSARQFVKKKMRIPESGVW